MQEHAVIEAAREFVRADESETMAARHADATAAGVPRNGARCPRQAQGGVAA